MIIKKFGNIACITVSTLWSILMLYFMFRCTQGKVDFPGRMGTPSELPLALGGITIGIIVVLMFMGHKNAIYIWTYIASLIPLLIVLLMLALAFFGIMAGA